MSRCVGLFAVIGLFGLTHGVRRKPEVDNSGEEAKPTLPPVPKEEQFHIDRLPIEFLIDEQAATLRDGDTNWFCVKIRLLPEDGGDKYAVLAKRVGTHRTSQYRVSWLPDEENVDSENMEGSDTFLMGFEPAADKQSSPYKSARAQTFIVGEHAAEDAVCNRRGGVYVRFADLQGYVHERMTKVSGDVDSESTRGEEDKDVLEKHTEKWNKRWARPAGMGANRGKNGCKTRKDCSGLHVSYVKIPPNLQQKIEQRLEDNWDTFYETYGAGIAGTTGAHFVAGNRGYRRPEYGGDMLDLLFQTDEDLKEYEASLASVVRNREDVRQKLGEHADIDFQHRLWRYGPDFSVRGGIWHRDTCPFGIGGGVPDQSWQLTSIYVLHASNLDLSQSGTRLKDRFGKTHEMPCIPGTTNIIRSGENDPFSPWHSGPVLRKNNASKPAYRVMMQSKMIMSRRSFETPAGVEKWGLLGIPELPAVPLAEEKSALSAWFGSLSQAVAWGASSSNAVGSEAYPIGAQKAWERTEELAKFVGFQGGFLPHFATPPVDVEDENAETPSNADSDWTEEFAQDDA